MDLSRRLLLPFTLFLTLLFTNCEKEQSANDVELLSEYLIQNINVRVIEDSLIACALGGQTGFLEDANFPLSILFYPEGNATNFRYFETDSVAINPDNFSHYKAQNLADSPIFNGYLRQFKRTAATHNHWGRVTYFKNGNLHISNAIRLKADDKPTEYNPELLTIDATDDKSPIFTWEDGRLSENVIYFHALLNENGDLVSGTYTFDKQFQFYNLENVVLNIRDVNPAPVLVSNTTYKMVIMGVSEDNWVNLVLERTFETKE